MMLEGDEIGLLIVGGVAGGLASFIIAAIALSAINGNYWPLVGLCGVVIGLSITGYLIHRNNA